jgi:hypothetical protein
LAYFDAIPCQTTTELLEEAFRKFGDANIQQLVSMLDPGFMIVSRVIGLIRARLDAPDPVLDSKLLAKLLGLFLRLRTIIRALFQISRMPEAIVSFLCCLFLNQSRDIHLFMASFYFTIVFDLKQVNFAEALNFARNIVKMATVYDPGMMTSMPQLFSHIAAHTSAALAPVLLGFPPDELPALLENPVIFSHEKVPNLTLKVIGKRINTTSIFFYFSRSGQGWSRDQAVRFILEFLRSCDQSVSCVMTAAVCDCLVAIVQMAREPNPALFYRAIFPKVMSLFVQNMFPALLPAMGRAIDMASRTGYMNSAMCLDWIRILLLGMFQKESKQVETDAILLAAELVIRGHKYALSLIPFVSTLLADFSIDRLIETRNVSQIMNYLSFVCFLGRVNKPDEVPLTLLKFVSDPQIECRISTIFQTTGFSSISIQIFKKLLDANKVPPNSISTLESCVSLMFFAELLECEFPQLSLSQLFIQLIGLPYARTDQFFQILQIATSYYQAIVKAHPGFFTFLLSQVSEFMFTKRCQLGVFDSIVRLISDLMIVTKQGPIFEHCLKLITTENCDHQKEIILRGGVNYVVANYGRLNGQALFQDDVTMFILFENQSLFGLSLKSDSFVVQVCEGYGSSVYQVRSARRRSSDVELAAATIQRSDIFSRFASCTSSSFLFDLISDVSRQEMKFLDATRANIEMAKARQSEQMQKAACNFGVVYIGPTQVTCDQVFTTAWNATSVAFRHFLNSLGEFITISLPREGGPPLEVHCLYWQDARYGATHIIAPLLVQALPSDASLATSVCEQILMLKVIIIWLEQKGFETKHFLSDQTKVLIVIRPTENPNCLMIAIEKNRISRRQVDISVRLRRHKGRIRVLLGHLV